MTAADILLELRTFKRQHGRIFRETGSPETLQASVADARRDLAVSRLKLKLESAFKDAQDQHLCAVADPIMAARVALQKEVKARLGIETEGVP